MEILVLAAVKILKDYFWYFVLSGLATAFFTYYSFNSKQKLMKNILLSLDGRGAADSSSIFDSLRVKGCQADAITIWMACLDLQKDGYLKTGANSDSLFNCQITEAGQKYLKEEDDFVPVDKVA